jgi:hypothetical protein
MKATKEQIKSLLDAIIDERNSLPEFSAFGDSNWVEADRKIAILQNALIGNIPERDIYSDDYHIIEWLYDTNNDDIGLDYGVE